MNHMLSQRSLIIALTILLSASFIQGENGNNVNKITGLKTAIHNMFALFIEQHPELQKNKNTIFSNLEIYGHHLTDNAIAKYHAMIKEVEHYKNYMHLAYNYSVFTSLEQLPKKSNS